jgi:leucyl/phenylalanyl-tRNA--protein transferase
VFFGESMFARASDASKVAFVHLVRQLAAWGFELIDCQMRTALLASFGAREIPRAQFTRRVAELVNYADVPAPWQLVAGAGAAPSTLHGPA